MAAQDWKDALSGLVFDADPNLIEIEAVPQDDTPVLSIKQRVHLRMERKGRGGKTVTIVGGYVGSDDELEALAAQLKQRCGVGGSVKDGEIVIQGDRREHIRALLETQGIHVRG